MCVCVCVCMCVCVFVCVCVCVCVCPCLGIFGVESGVGGPLTIVHAPSHSLTLTHLPTKTLYTHSLTHSHTTHSLSLSLSHTHDVLLTHVCVCVCVVCVFLGGSCVSGKGASCGVLPHGTRPDGLCCLYLPASKRANEHSYLDYLESKQQIASVRPSSYFS